MRLTRKLAGKIDGVDLQGFQVDDILDLPPQQAWLLVEERWAVPERRASERRPRHTEQMLAQAS